MCVGTSSANTTCTFLRVYQDAFAWLATVCDNKSVTSCQRTCCKLINLTGLLQLVSKVVTSLLMRHLNRLITT